MKSMNLRVDERAWKRLCCELFSRTDVESAGLLLAEPVQGSGRTLLVREAFPLPEVAYSIRRNDQLSIDPVAFNRLMRPARERGWSVFTIHTHPGALTAWFSAADDAGDARLMPSLACQIPHVPHGSIVLIEGGTAAARVFDAGGAASEIRVTVVGGELAVATGEQENTEPWFERQALALGACGQAKLRRLRVAVVGLGGIGAMVALQLAHLGVGELVLIDGDLIEPSNLSRVAGATRDDVGTLKVDVAARYAERLGLVRRVERHAEFLGPGHEHLIAGCDAVIACVDRQTPRALLNRFSYRYLLPTIDLGTAFRVDAEGAIVGDAGRVVIIGPGRPCLACWDHLDPDVLRIEALSEEERLAARRDGYIAGADEPEPSVIAFNTHVAGAGVVELLRLAAGFSGAKTPPLRLAFSFTNGIVRLNRLHGRASCDICSGKAQAAERDRAVGNDHTSC